MLRICLFVGFLALSSAFNLPGIPSAFTGDDEILSAISDDIAKKFADEYLAYKRTGIESAALRQMNMQLAAAHSKKDIFTKSPGELGVADQFVVCTTCRSVVNVMGKTFREPEGELNGPNAEEDARKLMLYICDRLNLQTEEVCKGLFELNWPFINYIMLNSEANSRSVCGALPIKFCTAKQPEFNFQLNIDKTGPAVKGPKKDVPKKSANDLHILHLTDIHVDPGYKPDSQANCDEPLCCQRTPTEGVVPFDRAGYWSDYRDCDSPLHMIDAAFDHIKATHPKIDYIFQTGDIIPHNVWETTMAGNKEMLTQINNLIAEKFPGIPVFSAVGNHESHPANLFGAVDAPEAINVKWLYEHLYTLWSKWLPVDTQKTIHEGGYYTVVPKKGYRVISLNNNDCYLFNWWVFQDGSWATKQLQWLHDTLLAAEKAGEYVHILLHIPPGDSDCWTIWAREYNRIIERFNNIIGGTFSGHTHVDELNLHYSEKGEPVGISWNGGSLTSFSNKNPNYVVYEVEPEKMQVVDYETWIFDLITANKEGASVKPKWYKEYQFSTEFTEDLSPAGLDALFDKMAEHPELLHKFWTYKRTSAHPYMAVGCDNKCMMRTICRLATTVYDQKTRCRALKAKLEPNLPDETTTTKPTTNAPGTTEKEEPTEKPDDDGAVTMVAMQMTSLLAIYSILKLLF